MTCTNIASLPYVVVLLTALLVRTLRPPGARVDTPYGPGCQVTRSAPPGTPIGTLVTAAQVTISGLTVDRIATWARTVAAYALATASGWAACLLRRLALPQPVLRVAPRPSHPGSLSVPSLSAAASSRCSWACSRCSSTLPQPSWACRSCSRADR